MTRKRKGGCLLLPGVKRPRKDEDKRASVPMKRDVKGGTRRMVDGDWFIGETLDHLRLSRKFRVEFIW